MAEIVRSSLVGKAADRSVIHVTARFVRRKIVTVRRDVSCGRSVVFRNVPGAVPELPVDQAHLRVDPLRTHGHKSDGPGLAGTCYAGGCHETADIFPAASLGN